SDLTDSECQFHATVIYASGGMVLSGDDLTKLPPPRAAMLKKLLPPSGIAATFEDATLGVGTVALEDSRMFCLFNWDDRPATRRVRLSAPAAITDFWSDAQLGRRESTLSVDLPPRSAPLLRARA